MSILHFPRIHFRGYARVNVPTGNRNTNGTIDIATNTVYKESQPFDASRPAEEFHEYLRHLPPRFNEDGQPAPDGVFSQAAGYNYNGNNHFFWENTRVVSVQTEPDDFFRDDALVGAKVQLWGHYNEYLRTSFNRARWVDNDPTRSDTTQIYAGQIILTEKESNATSACAFSSEIDCVHSIRWLGSDHIVELQPHFLNREIGLTRVFQFSVPKTNRHFSLHPERIDSAALRCLQGGLADPDVLGLTVQYTLFNMSTPIKPDSAVFYDLVGTIGLWKKSELATYPSGRVLVPQTAGFGPLAVQFTDGWVSLNMPATLPFSTRAARNESEDVPTHNLGSIPSLGTLQLETKAGTLVACIPEDVYQDFWRNTGVVDVPQCADAVDSLVLNCRAGRWTELDWVIQSDSTNIALEAPDRHRGKTYSLGVQVRSYFRGNPAAAENIPIRIGEPSVVHTTPMEQLSTGSDGITMLQIHGGRPGATKLFFDDQSNSIGVRVLPDDWHLADIPTEEVDYDFLYRHVLAYYELVYPFMADKVFSLADRCKCETYARLMWQMCDPQNRDKSYYMPSTRELSEPKARLFLKYLTNVEPSSRMALECLSSGDSDRKISTRYELVDELKKAVNLELSIMLQYLYSAYSIPSYEIGKRLADNGVWNQKQLTMACGDSNRRLNSGWRGTLLEVAHEEMIHYLVMNNLLMSLGEPFFPGETQVGQQAYDMFGLDTEFSFEPFSESALARFIRFEWPAYIPSAGKTIADFYDAIRQAFLDIPDLFTTADARRNGEHHLFLNELTNRSFPNYQLEVNDLQSALFAVDFVTDQGEGVSPESPQFRHSHFNRLRNIASALASERIPFEPSIPVLKNPVLEARPGCNPVSNRNARALMQLYQGCYELMFQMMSLHFSASPMGSLRRSRLMNAAIDVMSGLLRPLSMAIMSQPSGFAGRNAGPPVPLQTELACTSEYSAGCKAIAEHCLEVADYGRKLGTKFVGIAQIELLYFIQKQLLDLGAGNITREA